MINKIIKFLELDSDRKYTSYVYILFLIFSVYLLALNLNDIFHTHVYRQDALYYIQAKNYLSDKVFPEGRWINYLFFYLVSNVNGKILSLFVLSFLGFFMFFVSHKWTKNTYYSIILSLLFLQIVPLYYFLQWPATITPAFIVLLVSIYFYKRIKNVFLFFSVLGILFFGTMSNYYYLLPLLFLEYFLSHNWKQNLKFAFLKLLPAWIVGFIVGYIITQLIVYANFGHFMKIASWRTPHYIHSIDDLKHNLTYSTHYLIVYLKSIFSNFSIIVLSLIAIIISVFKRRKDLIFVPLFIFMLIALAHFVVIIPIGIYIAPRTVIPMWIAIFAILFFVPNIKRWQIYVLVPIIIFFSYNMHIKNSKNLKWYSTVTNVYFDKLIDVLPTDISKYKRLVIYANDSDISKNTKKISDSYNLKKDLNMGPFSNVLAWSAIGKEAKFKHVDMCFKDKPSKNKTCKKAHGVCENDKFEKSNDLYSVCGERKKSLIIKIND